MSFVRTTLAGDSPDNPPVVLDAGLPGFRFTIPITTPERQKYAALLFTGVAAVAFFTVAGAIAYAMKKRNT